MFYNSSAFIERFNNGFELPEKTEEIKLWLNVNRENMIAIVFPGSDEFTDVRSDECEEHSR